MSVAMHWDHWKKPSEMSADHSSVLVGRYVRNGQRLKNERERDQDRGGRRVPRLEPLFPIGPLTPSSPCGHKKKLERGSSFICMVCHQSGWEGHPDLVIDPNETLSPTRPEYATERPEPVEDRVEVKAEKQWENLTRKQKRTIMFGSKEQSLVRPSDDADASPDPAAAGQLDRRAIDDALVANGVDADLAARLAAVLGRDLPA
jgi:hypothetical protein